MRLDNQGIENKGVWEAAGYQMPKFDRKAVEKATKTAPRWVHFGAGNIFRAFQAKVVQDLLDENIMDTGLVVAEGYDYEIIEKMDRPHDNLSILVTLKSSGEIEKTVIASMLETLRLDTANEEEFERLKEVFRNPSLQMGSFTITEKGYSLVDGKGELADSIRKDFAKGPQKPESYIGKVVSLLYERYQNGQLPIAMVSMDNCSHNGTKLYEAVNAFAKEWCSAGLADKGFETYINDSNKVSFPWSMIDKITPRPDAKVKEMLKKDEIDGLEELVTQKGTYVAPFVNAEECQYLVIEDAFPNGRPPLEKGGVIFTDKETVDKVEKMKVCTCLNPLHTALAVFGCLLNYQLISEEMKNPQLRRLVEIIGYEEGLPVVVNPGIIEPKKFIDEVLNIRIPNPFMPDTPQRIATDTSQKLPIRYGETIKAYQNREDLSTQDLKMIPLVYAAWMRYLLGVDDTGNAFSLSSDPLLEEVCLYVKDIDLEAKDRNKIENQLKPLLQKKNIFGVDLYETRLAELIVGYFMELTNGVGAVQRTLEKYVI